MSRLLVPLLFLVLFAPPASAQEWPAEARAQMEAAGARLKAAGSTEERVAALREIEAVAAAYPDAPDARITAALVSQQATIEAGPAVMLEAMAELAASGQITDVETYAGIAGPLVETVAQMQEDGTLLPSAAIALNDAVSKLDAAAAKAGLPKVADAIAQATGDPALGSALTNSLKRLAAAAKVAEGVHDLAGLDEKATKEFIDNIVSIGPPIPALGVNQVGYVMFRDTLAWNNQMYGEASKAMNLVADAIETGQFDHAAYNQIRDRLNDLSKGPWGSDTAKDVLKSLCKAIPVAGAWCDDAFKLAQELISGGSCSAITCDCENVGGGLMRGPLIVQCKLQEQDLISQCNAGNDTGVCQGDAKGPGATR